MKKILFLVVSTLVSVTGFSQEQLTAVNKTGCPVLFSFKAFNINDCSTNYDFEFIVQPSSNITHNASPDFIFNTVKAVQLNTSQTCQSPGMIVSPNNNCVVCPGLAPSDEDSAFIDNCNTCDQIIYMRYVTPCSGSTYNISQVVVTN